MEYKSKRKKIKETTDYDVAGTLAYIAKFPKGTVIRHRNPGDHKGTGRTVIVFHPDTIAKDPEAYFGTQNPDILVSQFTGDEYLIQFNPDKIEESLTSDLEKELVNTAPK